MKRKWTRRPRTSFQHARKMTEGESGFGYRAVSERIRLGGRNRCIPGGRGVPGRRARPVDLGHVLPHPRQSMGRRQRRCRMRHVSPLPGRHQADEGSRHHVLPVLGRLAADHSGRFGRDQPEGHRVLPQSGGRAAGTRHRADADAVPLGSPAGAAGPRRLGEPRDDRSFSEICRDGVQGARRQGEAVGDVQ